MQHDCDNPPRGSTLSRLGATYRNEGVDEVDGTTPAKTSKQSEDEEEPSSRKCTARFNVESNRAGRLDGAYVFFTSWFFFLLQKEYDGMRTIDNIKEEDPKGRKLRRGRGMKKKRRLPSPPRRNGNCSRRVRSSEPRFGVTTRGTPRWIR